MKYRDLLEKNTKHEIPDEGKIRIHLLWTGYILNLILLMRELAVLGGDIWLLRFSFRAPKASRLIKGQLQKTT